MPLNKKGKEIMSSMKSKYGEKEGESVFYASKNAGKIRNVDHGFYGHINTQAMAKRFQSHVKTTGGYK